MQFITCISVFAAVILGQQPAIKRSESVLVRTVFDGDTIDVANVGRVRLLGIDAPEIGRVYDTAAPFGREARDRLVALVLHRWIRLETEGQQTDMYDRRLAYVLTEDGQFVNAVLVREGLARVTARVPLSRLPELQKAEAEAQAFRRGMWGALPAIPTPSYTHPPRSESAPQKPKHRRPKSEHGRSRSRRIRVTETHPRTQ
jgi:micrococcal nuclease